LLNQNDIDQLELMNPKMTPEHYMKNILNYYNKEKNLRSKSNRNEPMQQALSRHRQLNPIKRFKYGGESVN